jgi:glycosyltransferase involved in cell wall biosynthesis
MGASIMRVTMVCKDSEVGGIFRSCVELSDSLSARGLGVTVIAPEVRGPTIAGRACRIRRPRSFGRVCSTELSPGLVCGVLGDSADLLHLHLPCPVGVAASLFRRTGQPLVVSYHCDLDRRFGGAASVYESATRIVLERAAAILVSGESIRRSPMLQGLLGRCEIVPYGIDPARIESGENLAREADALRIEHGPFALFVGRLVYYKGLDVLLDALRRVPAPLRLVIAGMGSERARLEARVRTIGLAERVRFVGFVPDFRLPAYLHAADMLVLPSTSHAEAFGLVQVEAALAGLPVICSEVGTGTSSVTLHDRTGIVVSAGDPGSLADAMSRLLEPGLRRRLGDEGRRRARHEFTSVRQAAAVHEVYERVLGVAPQA